MKRTMMAACILSLVACGGSKDDVATDQQRDWESQRQSLVYSFPDQGQLEVPVPSPVVLRFSSPVAETAPAIELREVGGAAVAGVELEWVDGKRGLIITPENKLKPLTEYVVQVPAIELEKGQAAARTIRFTTRGLHEGPRSLVARDTFEVVRTIPDGVNFAVTDFSSFRLQFSQPLDPSTVKYGDAGDSTVQLMGPDGLVDAHLLVSGPYITIDPKEDLTPGGDYSLNITGGLTSVYGDNLTGGSLSNPMPYTLTATPVDTTSPTTGERVSMVQDIADTGEISPLTGKPINLVPMASVLLGEETATQASGTLAAELAFVPNFPDQTPLRIKRGSLIEGASIDVLIGGEVPAGFESGKVRMDFLSDATGYLLPNEYSNTDDAPRQVRLWMDVAVSTETPAANGAITQDLLHIELVGTSIVEDGQMVINAVGVVEPNVLGSERATGLLSFYMKAYEDQDNPPSIGADNTSPVIQSWVPGLAPEMIAPHDPIIVNFSEPLDPETVTEESVWVLENGMPFSASVTVDGSAVIVRPLQPFKKSEQISFNDIREVVYEVQFSNDISDISGNRFMGASEMTFSLPAEVSEYTRYHQLDFNSYSTDAGWDTGTEEVAIRRSPLVLFMMPGFPCVFDPVTISLENKVAGRCAGALASTYTSGSGNIVRTEDDLLPLQKLPSNRPILISFSKEIDQDSVSLGGSFVVEKKEGLNSYSPVSGEVKLEGKRLTFYPSTPWEEDRVYRYILRSNGDDIFGGAVTQCNGTQAICDVEGLPLQTKVFDTSLTLQAPDMVSIMASPEAGGPDMIQYFEGAKATSEIFLSMVGPSADENANFWHESNMMARPEIGMFDALFVNYKEYGIQERNASGSPLDPEAHPLDVEGVLAPVNSAKVISLTVGEADPTYTGAFLNGLSVGCGWNAISDPGDADEPRIPLVCPEDKFTYLTSAIGADITTEYIDGEGLRVNIWPGQIMSTSINIYTMLQAVSSLGLPSGPQLMRMRYGKDDPSCEDSVMVRCARNKPIPAVIRSGENGKAVLQANVDVYIDAVGLFNSLAETPLAGLTHNMSSVPATLDLEGEIAFLDDGRMVVEQVNINDVKIDFEIEFGGYTNGAFELLIPAYGTRLKYVGDVIK